MNNKDLIKDCVNKLNKLNDMSWEDIVSKYDLDLNPHELRKRSYGMKMAVESLSENDNADDETLLEIKKEKVKLTDLRTLVNRDIRQLARVENIIDLIKEECNNINEFKFIDDNEVEFYKNGSKANLLVSDIHYNGSKVPIDNFNVLIDKTINICEFHKINQLNIMFAGDLINNELKNTIRIENQENVSKQIVNVAKLISEGLYKLSKHIPMVVYTIVDGNHDRSIENYKDALSTDTYTPLIQEIVSLRVDEVCNIVRLSNMNVKGNVDSRFSNFTIGNKNHVVFHGNGLKNIEKNAIPTLEGYLDMKIDYLYIGHFHNAKEIEFYDSNIIVNSALYNRSDYGKKLLLRNKESQKLMILDDDGDIECTYNIKINK